jgi:hypothetical protein
MGCGINGVKNMGPNDTDRESMLNQMTVLHANKCRIKYGQDLHVFSCPQNPICRVNLF